MREYLDSFGRTHDLDDPETYKRLPQEKSEVLSELYEKVGYTLLYFMGTNWSQSESGKKQVERVNQLVAEIAQYFGAGAGKNMWAQPTIFWQEKLFVFLDETENLC